MKFSGTFWALFIAIVTVVVVAWAVAFMAGCTSQQQKDGLAAFHSGKAQAAKLVETIEADRKILIETAKALEEEKDTAKRAGLVAKATAAALRIATSETALEEIKVAIAKAGKDVSESPWWITALYILGGAVGAAVPGGALLRAALQAGAGLAAVVGEIADDPEKLGAAALKVKAELSPLTTALYNRAVKKSKT